MKLKILCLICTCFFSSVSFSKTKLKVAVLAPENTSWANNLKKFADDVKEHTKGEVTFKIYYGGIMGDEPDVLRKIHIGQLHGGIFTGKTLGDISGDIRVMEIPYTFFSDRDKALATLEKLLPYFEKKAEESDFVSLGFFELGMVYFISQKKTEKLDDLKGLKIWTWQGDDIVTSLIKSMDLVSVPLPLTDVLSSLSTGMIEAAYAPPLGIVSLQWNTKVKYLIDFPLAFSIGAMMIKKSVWDKIKPEYQTFIMENSQKLAKQVNEDNNNDNIQALEAMKEIGVEFLKFQDEDLKKAQEKRSEVVEELKGKLFSEEAYNKLTEALD